MDNVNKGYSKDDVKSEQPEPSNSPPDYSKQEQPGYPAQHWQPDYPAQQQPGYTAQEQPGYPAPHQQIQTPEAQPPNYLGLATFARWCCCWPIGMAAVKAASQVDIAYAQGDYERAKEKSQKAMTLSLVSIGCGVLSLIVIIVIFVIYLQLNL